MSESPRYLNVHYFDRTVVETFELSPNRMGHEQFILNTFQSWGVTQPDIVVKEIKDYIVY